MISRIKPIRPICLTITNNMDMAIVTGRLWATRKDPTLEGTQFVIIQPIDENREPMGEPLIANDITNQIGPGETVFFVTGGDAALLEEGELRPVDAAVVGIVDSWSASNSKSGESLSASRVLKAGTEGRNLKL